MCVAVGIAGAAVAGGAISATGAESAASQQAGAAEQAMGISQNEFQQIEGMESPYLQGGYNALGALQYGLGTGPAPVGGAPAGVGAGSLTQPFTADYMKQYSPAYQFQLQQGQQGVLNQDAGAQGAESGAALKDLTSFNQNYANTAYNTAANQYLNQNSAIYSRLAGLVGTGQAAASQQATSGTALAGQAAQSATNIGTAQAAGTVGAANSLSGGLQTGALLGSIYGGQAGGFNPNLNNYNLSNPNITMDPSTGLPAGGSIG